jgi:hypothetical protein
MTVHHRDDFFDPLQGMAVRPVDGQLVTFAVVDGEAGPPHPAARG